MNEGGGSQPHDRSITVTPGEVSPLVPAPFVWIVVRTNGGSRWLAGVFAPDAELEARRVADAPHHGLMQVTVTQKGDPPLRSHGD
jgi:hypothetical protein